jgi:hypothetical protein
MIRNMGMAKTIYIRDEDIPTWDRAKELAGDKLAPKIMEGLRRFVVEKEAAAKGFARIVIEYNDADDGRLPKARAFVGRWIIPREEPLRLATGSPFDTATAAVAESQKGGCVVFTEESGDSYDEPEQRLHKFKSFGDALADPGVNYAVRKALEKRGVEVEELDIWMMNWIEHLSAAEMVILKFGSVLCVTIFVYRAIRHEIGRK